MFRPRIIPVLLLSQGAAVKTKQFGNPIYLGDIINTARIFSEFKADELIVMDIHATRENRCIDYGVVAELSQETGMPLAIGGGIRSNEEVAQLINAGAEKVIFSTKAFQEQDAIRDAVAEFGSSTISVCVDVWKGEEHEVRYNNGTIKSQFNLEKTIKHFERLGVGEIIVQSINNDGMRSGYDLDMLSLANSVSSVPIVALGGAGSLSDLSKAYKKTHCSAYAASSMFVFHKNGVLISYPERKEIEHLFID